MEPNIDNPFPGESTARIRLFLMRFWPYIPLWIVLEVLGVISAYTYLKYAHHFYETKAKVILAENTNPTKDEKSGEILLKLDNEANGSFEQAIETFQSRENMSYVVKDLNLYAELVSKGRFINKSLFGVGSPLIISSPKPDSLKEAKLIPFQFKKKSHEVCFGGHCYPIGKIVKTEFGDLSFSFQPNYVEKEDKKFFLNIIPIQKKSIQILKRLKITPKSKESNIVDIFLQDEIPQRAQAVIPQMILIYDSLSTIQQKEANVNIIKFIDNRLKVVSNELSGIEKELQKAKSTFKTESLTTEETSYFNKTQELENRKNTISTQFKILDDVESFLNKRYSSSKKLPSFLELTNPTLTNQLLQLFEVESQLDHQIAVSGESNPQTIYLQERLGKLKPAIIESIHNLKRTYLIDKNSLDGELLHYNSLLNEVPEQQRKVLDITRRQNVVNGIYTYLLQKKEDISLNSASIHPDTQILERPDSSTLVSPVDSQIYILAALIALGLSASIIAISEALDNVIKSRLEVERVLSVPIIGEVNRIQKMDPEKPILIGKDIKTVVAEQFRSIRTNLNYLGVDSKRKVILITSSIMKEGKSFIALNMAIAISLSGKKVLLLDFDLRKPKLSGQLAPNQALGITNYLIGNINLNEIIKEVPDYPNLFFAPSGTIPPNPSEIILGKQTANLLKETLPLYDYILIDSPPVGIVTDGKLLAPFIDSTLYVIRQGITPILFLRFIDKLQKDRILPNIGIVINSMKGRRFEGYSYDYKYSYGYNDAIDDRWDKKLMRKILNNK